MVKKEETTDVEVVETVETTTTKKAVKLTKDGVTFTLSDPIMISAFVNQGYVYVEE